MKECRTCKWYAYLTTLGRHICHAPECSGVITEQEVENVAKHGCDVWEPRMGVAS